MKHELYESPIVEVMEVEIEQGFAGSVGGTGDGYEVDGQSYYN